MVVVVVVVVVVVLLLLFKKIYFVIIIIFVIKAISIISRELQETRYPLTSKSYMLVCTSLMMNTSLAIITHVRTMICV